MTGVYPGITLPMETRGAGGGEHCHCGASRGGWQNSESWCAVRRSSIFGKPPWRNLESFWRRAVEELVQEVAFFDPEEHDEEVLLLYRARELGFDLEGTRVGSGNSDHLSPSGDGGRGAALSAAPGAGIFFSKLAGGKLIVSVERFFSPAFTPSAFCGQGAAPALQTLSRGGGRKIWNIIGFYSSVAPLCSSAKNGAWSFPWGWALREGGIGDLSRSSREALRALRNCPGEKTGDFRVPQTFCWKIFWGASLSKDARAFARHILAPLKGAPGMLASCGRPFSSGGVYPPSPLERRRKSSISIGIPSLCGWKSWGIFWGWTCGTFRQGVLLYLAYLMEEGEGGLRGVFLRKSGGVSRVLSCAVIYLGCDLHRTSSDRTRGSAGHLIPPYSILLRTGFA